MSDSPPVTVSPGTAAVEGAPDMKLFWACFISLIATAFGFIIRAFLMGEWQTDYGFSGTQRGELFGVGLWPFAISIVLFSLVIDRIGYGKVMAFAFAAHIASAIITIAVPTFAGDGPAAGETAEFNAVAYWMLYVANFIVALGNGAVEAVVNPVVASMFVRDKTKWLSILHAGWPGGLALAGTVLILLGDDIDWRIKVALMFLPVVAYGLMMIGAKFPISERVASGVSYKEMLREFGMGGALIVSYLMFSEIGRVIVSLAKGFGTEETAASVGSIVAIGKWVAIAAATVGFGAVVRFAIGRPLFLFLCLIMVPLASTELGVDSWIEELMKRPVELDFRIASGWVLVYTSIIMMVLRFFAGSIVHKISPLGLLAGSSVLAIIGLLALSNAAGIAILLAATIYAFGKSFFWPTMLGVVAEQFPRGGALTLNAVAGIGMLGVGVVGNPTLGYWVDSGRAEAIQAESPELYETVVKPEPWVFSNLFGNSPTLNKDAVDALPADQAAFINGVPATINEETDEVLDRGQPSLEDTARQQALTTVTMFPIFMLACYLGLIAYFKTRGGYQAEVITGDDGRVKDIVEHTPADPIPAGPSEEQFTGGVEGPAGA